MSQSRNKKNKAKKARRTQYQKSIARQIRNGDMPRFFLAKQVQGSSILETKEGFKYKRIGKALFRGAAQKLTWRQVGTYKELTKEDKDETK